MPTIRLPLRSASAAERYPEHLLEQADTFGITDQEYYDVHGWDSYRPEHHLKTLLPEFGPARYFRDSQDKVVSVGGLRYRVSLEVSDIHEMYESDGKVLVLEETDDPESVPEECRGRRILDHFFGQPTWVQNEQFVTGPLGRPCSHFLTVENEWGDMGNWNISLGLGLDDVPEVAYFEASCH